MDESYNMMSRLRHVDKAKNLTYSLTLWIIIHNLFCPTWQYISESSLVTQQDTTSLPEVLELEDSEFEDEVKENVRVSVQHFLQVKIFKIILDM